MKNKGISIVGIIVMIGLIAGISWGLNYIITKDYIIVRPPTNAIAASTVIKSEVAQIASSTPTSTPSQVSVNIVAATSSAASTIQTSKPKPPTTSPSTSTGLTVTYTDKGFSPASLTVAKGQTVKFVNNGTGSLWVSANPFPTASEYPTFNEKSGVASGSSWSFTFTQTGTWYYHNHYSPAIGAKIVVNAK
ncbi:TPA: hypothetical protein DCQ44_02810 [Candidatus Taylorbacteria bacterium]|nr:hypothetical protein [Candidatus Taylorbacteria bacterium]